MIPEVKFVDYNRNPIVKGKIYVYKAGTEDLVDIYADENRTIEQQNPAIINNGEANVWLPDGSFKIAVYDDFSTVEGCPEVIIDNVDIGESVELHVCEYCGSEYDEKPTNCNNCGGLL